MLIKNLKFAQRTLTSVFSKSWVPDFVNLNHLLNYHKKNRWKYVFCDVQAEYGKGIALSLTWLSSEWVSLCSPGTRD